MKEIYNKLITKNMFDFSKIIIMQLLGLKNFLYI